MALQDWIDVPRRREELDDRWGNFVARWNGWMRELVADSAAQDASIDAIEAELDGHDAASWVPSWTNIGVTNRVGRRATVGDRCYFFTSAEVTSAATGFILVGEPATPNAVYSGLEIPTILWNAEINATGVSYSAVGNISSGSISARRTANAGQSGAWTTAVPTVFAAGDRISLGGWFFT